MIKHLLVTGAVLFGAYSVCQAETKAYFTDDFGEVYGVSSNGKYAAVTDSDNSRAYLWSESDPENFVSISMISKPGLPSAQTVIGTVAMDVTDDGMVVGCLIFKDGHREPAFYKDGEWTSLPVHPASLNTNEAIAVTADGSVIAGYQFIYDPSSGIGGRYYPCQWFRLDDGYYELKAYTDVKLPDHQGFVPLTQSPDGKIIAGQLYCAVGSTIPALIVEGQLKIFDELTSTQEPLVYRGRYYAGLDEKGNQVWVDDINDPRVVFFNKDLVNGFYDGDGDFMMGALTGCDNQGNFYGRRSLPNDVDEDGYGWLQHSAAIYNYKTDTWSYDDSKSVYTAGLGEDYIFADNGTVIIDGNEADLTDAFQFKSSRTVVGVNKISADGRVLGGICSEMNEAIGEMMYYPFVLVLDSPLAGVQGVYGDVEKAIVVVGQNRIEVVNAENVKIFDVQGRLVSTSASADVESGIYVIKADDSSFKVLVK